MNEATESTGSEHSLLLEGVTKSYECDGKQLEVLEPTTLSVRAGEVFVLLGPSGCGKTTMLRIIAGLEVPNSGHIVMDGHPVDGPSPKRGIVFQDFTSFPWLTVAQNIAFGLRLRGHDPDEIAQTVEKWIKRIGLEGFAEFYPNDLSGGMQQRVAIARTLANDPSLVLMDEPFGSLDAQTRWQMQEMLLKLQRETTMTIVFVTHDVEEALLLGNRIAVLSARPARILREFPVPLGVDRDRSVTRTPTFVDLEQQIHLVMRGEVE